MRAEVRRFFRRLDRGGEGDASAWGSLALRIGLEPASGPCWAGPCPWDAGAVLTLDGATGDWRVEPTGAGGGFFELLGRIDGRSPLRAGLAHLGWDVPPEGGSTDAWADADLATDHPAVSDRGISPAEAAGRGIGWVAGPDGGRLAVTVFDIEGRAVGQTLRRLEAGADRPERSGRVPPRWLTSPGFPAGQHLYNLDRAWPAVRRGRCAVLVEGPFDALHLDRCGWPNALALLGNRVTGWHVDLLITVGAERLVLLLDNDHGGRLGSRWALEHDGRLDQFEVVDRRTSLPRGRDPDELGPAELATLLGPARRAANPGSSDAGGTASLDL